MGDDQSTQSELDALSRRRLVAGYFVAAVLVVATIAAVLTAVTGGGSAGGGSADDAFAANYEGLEQRRLAAGVPTMAEGGGEHFHPQLELFVEGEEILVPANIGIDPVAPPTEMAGLHTHDSSGTIHNEAGTGSTLGQFFVVWGIPLSEQRLGPYRAKGEDQVRMWVDGESSSAFGDLELADGQQIVIAYGSPSEMPPDQDL